MNGQYLTKIGLNKPVLHLEGGTYIVKHCKTLKFAQSLDRLIRLAVNTEVERIPRISDSC